MSYYLDYTKDEFNNDLPLSNYRYVCKKMDYYELEVEERKLIE